MKARLGDKATLGNFCKVIGSCRIVCITTTILYSDAGTGVARGATCPPNIWLMS